METLGPFVGLAWDAAMENSSCARLCLIQFKVLHHIHCSEAKSSKISPHLGRIDVIVIQQTLLPSLIYLPTGLVLFYKCTSFQSQTHKPHIFRQLFLGLHNVIKNNDYT